MGLESEMITLSRKEYGKLISDAKKYKLVKKIIAGEFDL